MLEPRKAAVGFDERELLELARIIADGDEKEALAFPRESVYRKVVRSQQGRLKSHLDTAGDPVDRFRQGR